MIDPDDLRSRVGKRVTIRLSERCVTSELTGVLSKAERCRRERDEARAEAARCREAREALGE